MTKEEAIAYFKRHIELYCVTGICREAEEMAIRALEQEPCEDAISRQAVLEFIEKQIDHSLWAFEKLVKGIKALPSVPPKPMTDILDKIRAEIEKAIWEDILPISDETGEITDEIRTPLLEPDDVFEIIDKYKAESENKA